MRSPLIATEPYPAPRLDACHKRDGPEAGHCFIKPVSFDSPLRSGPRHCGQSEGAGDCATRMTAIPRPRIESPDVEILNTVAPYSLGAGFARYSLDCASLLRGVTLSGSMRTIR